MDKQNRWLWTLIQGVIAIGIGLWALFGRSSALEALTYVAAIYVALAGLIQTLRAMLTRGAPDSNTELVRGLIGLIGGAVVLILAFFTETSTSANLTILAVVLIVYGVVGLFSTFFARGGRPFEWQPVLVNALMVLLGALVFFDRTQELDVVLWSAIVFIVAGITMVLYAYMRQRGHAEVTAAV